AAARLPPGAGPRRGPVPRPAGRRRSCPVPAAIRCCPVLRRGRRSRACPGNGPGHQLQDLPLAIRHRYVLPFASPVARTSSDSNATAAAPLLPGAATGGLTLL